MTESLFSGRTWKRLVLVVVAVALITALQCLSTSLGVVAFSASAQSPTKSYPKEFDSATIQETASKFHAWKNAACGSDTNTIREYMVKEEDLQELSTRNSRISHFATRIFSDSLQTSNAANLACRGGNLMVNATKVSGGRILKVGDILLYNSTSVGDRRTILPSDPLRAERFCVSRLKLLQTLSNEELSHTPLRVLYEDDAMAIVCKPAGVHSMSWSGSLGKSLCLDEILPLVLSPPEFDKNTDNDDESLPAPLPRHRLDHRVAGPVVVAKTRKASVAIGRAFEEKTVTKEYRAIVVGDIDMDTIGNVDGISNVDHDKQSFSICSDVDDKQSETEVQVLGKTPCNINGILTDLKLFPRTGRKHQLRIHCAKVLGTPILGDDLYWDSVGVEVRKRQGLYLYCKQVSIEHPLENRQVSAGIEEPLRFTRTRKKARKGYEWSQAQAESSED